MHSGLLDHKMDTYINLIDLRTISRHYKNHRPKFKIYDTCIYNFHSYALHRFNINLMHICLSCINETGL